MNFKKANKWINKIPLHAITVLLILLWVVPTLGVFITSFRPIELINTSGWWTFLSFKHTGEELFTVDNYVDAIVGYHGSDS